MKRLWSNSLVSKVFLSFLAVVILLFGSFYYYSSTVITKSYIGAVSSRMEQEAHLLGQVLSFDIEGSALDAACRQLARQLGTRISVIAIDGRVLGDSTEASAKMENHASRPEVLEAVAHGTGTSVRHSTTVGYDMLYRAFLQQAGSNRRIVRVSIPLTELEQTLATIRRALLIGLAAASASGLLLAWAFSRHITARVKRLVEFSAELSRGSFPQRFFTSKHKDEIHLLEQHLNEMSEKIRDNIQRISAETEKIDSILRCMIEGVLVLDPRGRILVINEQAATMFQLPKDRDFHGAPISELSRHPGMRRIIQEVLAFDFTSGRYSKEIDLADDRWFRVNAASLRNGMNQVVGTIFVFHDIAEIKRFEIMRSDLVANVSHELRTPLTAIRGYVETLLHSPPSDPADMQQFLSIVARHSQRLSRLTEDLLTLSDLESGKARLNLQPVDATLLLQRVLEVFWDQAGKKQIKLAPIIESGLPQFFGDFDRLQQLFINLIDNALKHTPPKGTITVSASRLRTATKLDAVEIAIADTGTGIAEKDLPRITERFYRVDKARSRELGGTGLGLAIVKHIAQAHKAELRIDSALNKGTTVRVVFSAAVEQHRDEASAVGAS
jgi:two-component system, OmpR family, phosphate regulon sensor histidine kinase PhoR